MTGKGRQQSVKEGLNKVGEMVKVRSTTRGISGLMGQCGGDEYRLLEQRSKLLEEALYNIYDICIKFDHPKSEDLFHIAQQALRKAGRI